MDTHDPQTPGAPAPGGSPGGVSRRRFLGLAGGAALVAGVGTWTGRVLAPEQVAAAADAPPNLYLAGTDGWIHLPPTPAIGAFHPDNLAPPGLTTYIFGFRNVTGMTDTQRLNQKNKAQHSAPMFWVDQYDPTAHNEFRVQLTNLGLALRPDLFDAHTLHWHGFRNVIPFYDGEPTGSVSVPAGREFTYVYRPREAGTYMFHCHVEDVEHVHMGMTGLVFVRPSQNRTGNPAGAPVARLSGGASSAPMGYLYNDGVATTNPTSTAYDREFAMFLSEVWAEAHWADAHIQLPEWSDYRADFALLNGRVYPDTVVANGSVDAFHPVFDANGDLIAPAGRPDLQYQPISSLVRCNEGERVALRFSNLGFRESAMTITGIRMRVVGRDATPMKGRDGTDASYETDTLNIGPGESYDVLFTAPTKTGSGAYDTYYLYNRSFARSNNLAPGGFGGQTTEIRVYASGVGSQSYPNDWGN
jgi:FtsP/CotA-like multicopper oxidase with cupredoxin domain